LEAAELIRTFIERIVLVPENGELTILLRGDLAGILAIAVAQKLATATKNPTPFQESGD
jgi:site-specific DNA recombinase